MSNSPQQISPVSQPVRPAQTAPPRQATPPQPTPAQPAASQPTPAQPQSPAPAHQAAPQQQPWPAFIIPSAHAPEPKTRRERLAAGDACWKWKIGLRAICVIVGIIGIGCAAWAVSKYGPGKLPYEFEIDDAWSIEWSLITFVISVIWSAVCIAVFFLRSPNAPVHPGAQVGVDLVLWLAFIPTALFATIAVLSVSSWGSNGDLSGGGYYYSSSYGHYEYVPGNNTWVWNAGTSTSSYSDGRSCASSSSSSYYGNYNTFANCTEEDAFVNKLWQGKSERFSAELTVVVCQFIGLVLHLTLFVWACVDTHRRNSRKVCKEAEQLAADIVMNMVRAGAIIPAPGAAQLRPMGPQMQMYPQQYPQQYLQQYPQQYPQPQSVGSQPFVQQPGAAQQGAPRSAAPQPAAASSSNEKGMGRYA